MLDWYRRIQRAVDAIDEQLKQGLSDEVTLHAFAGSMRYSPFHASRRFRQLTGLSFREYLHRRKLAFALVEVREGRRTLLDIAVTYGFSSGEAFSRAFGELYGMAPSEYRRAPRPVVLRTKLTVLDRYLLETGANGMEKTDGQMAVYYVQIPAHKFLHVKNYDSDGYMDFWEKQDAVPGQDCDTICGLLDSIRGKLDGDDQAVGVFSGQIMGYLREADGRTPQAYGVRLPADYAGPVPGQMLLLDVPAGECIVFEHGPFDFETQCGSAFAALEKAIADHRHEGSGYAPDTTAGRAGYFYHDPTRFMKKVFPVRRES